VVVVEQVLGIVLAQPVQGERRAGAVGQQPVACGTVSGRDAHRAVDGETAVMRSLRHRLRLIVRQQATGRSPRLRGRRIVVQAAPVRVRGDLDAIGLALRNLVESALAHGTGGFFIRFTCAGTREAVSRAVIDDGPGVAPVELPSLAKRFAVVRGPRRVAPASAYPSSIRWPDAWVRNSCCSVRRMDGAMVSRRRSCGRHRCSSRARRAA
jgi:hypothetical protein